MTDLLFQTYTGADIATVFDGLAQLRITVFREFPYLYEGSVDYEKAYLNTYAQSERALLLTVVNNGKLVGATTCLPLRDETDEVQAPFITAGIDLDYVFYFGESLLLPHYRGWGIGHRFFDVREAHARSFGTYRLTCFCVVQRPDNHLLRPVNYRPLNRFWQQRGYRPDPALQTTFSWPDIGETTETAKPMQFWTREIPR
ncbi:GNAT family N-acetyltransferase [Fibrella aquatilis]|uniref:GNAT family N-acetyltransferase n=1 Tax=Fibrella aquatilis TaxID=2817059 RepID=A0A939GCV2_9BACT|nr:GNAT family N-acetyltransferase [Fibrella aquatilis]MBO0934500.1 GNAT family N-acetyltransferase [Fibrella aquatilis]